MAFAAELERLALSLSGSGDWAADSVIDDRMRIFELSPDFYQELF